MRILLLCDGMGLGGAETHIATLAAGLAKAGDEVALWAQNGALSARLGAAGVKLLKPAVSPRSPLFWTGAPANLLSLSAFCRAWNPDVTHAHTRRTAFLLAGLPSAAGRKIVTVHARFAGWRRISYWGDRTIAISDDLAAHLSRHFGVAHRRITVIPNGIDLRHFSPPDTPPDSDTFRIVFASRLDADCSLGAALLLQCAAGWADAIRKPLFLTITGGGDCLPTLKAEAGRLRNRGVEISFSGGVSDPAPFFRQADLFVGVSRCALEAAACGSAVILCGNEDFGGLLTPANFDRFARCNFTCRGEALPTAAGLDRAFSDCLQAKAAGSAGFSAVTHRVRESYSDTAMVARTRRVYCQSPGIGYYKENPR